MGDKDISFAELREKLAADLLLIFLALGLPIGLASTDRTFGDGDTAQGAIVTKQFDSAGTYPVTLRVTDDLGRIATRTIAVTVLEPVVPAGDEMP